jgi:nitroreductase
MDTRLAIASRREVRDYRPDPLPTDVADRILDAGRLAGSGGNRQPWTFVVTGARERLAQLARGVYEPTNIEGAALVVAIVVRGKGPVSFDAGRAAQNMLLAAWNEGVGGSPNGVADEAAARAALDLADEEERIAIVLSLGYPARPRDPSSRTPEEWSARAKRRPLSEIVRWLR